MNTTPKIISSAQRDFYPARLLLALGVGGVAYLVSGVLHYESDPYPAQMAAAVTGFVAACWLSNALPMGAASLLPLPLFSMLGVLPLSVNGAGYGAATAYAHPILWLFFGGFVLALGIERWSLHRRIALWIIARFGIQPNRLVLGFMVASAGLSMWLMNTSTTLMLLPIAMALVTSLTESGAIEAKGAKNFAFTLLLGIAYASSLGGIATPIGTAPNALYLSTYRGLEQAGAPPMTFLLWMLTMMPMTLVMVPGVWWLMTRFLAPVQGVHPEAAAILRREAEELPPMSQAEKSMLGLFALAGVLWTTRGDIALGEAGTIPGWWRLMPVPSGSWIGDGAVAVLVALLSFVLPSGRRPGEALMNWETARKIPWDILFLLGGGIAIAEAFNQSGLAAAMGHALEPLITEFPPLLSVLTVCAVMTFLTEVTSNTAITSLFLPILLAASTAAGLDPRLLMLPATLSASCAFMLPIATPPNAIVFASGHIPMGRMAKVGLYVNIVGVLVVTALVWFLARPLLDIELVRPPWLVSSP